MMSVTILQDVIGLDWQRKVSAMAAQPEDLQLYAQGLPAHASKTIWQDEMRIHRLVAAWPLRELIALAHPVYQGATSPLVAWWVGDGKKVSEAMVDAGVAFALEVGIDPQVAYMQKLPANAHEFVDVRGIILAQAKWVPEGFLAVMRGGLWRGLPVAEKSK